MTETVLQAHQKQTCHEQHGFWKFSKTYLLRIAFKFEIYPDFECVVYNLWLVDSSSLLSKYTISVHIYWNRHYGMQSG